ncbi:MAG: uracil-DNA glycosylase [Alphaproteobacteria bacterium]
MNARPTPRQVLHWYLESGVDEAIGEVPVDRYALSAVAVPSRPSPEPRRQPPPLPSPPRPASPAPAPAADTPAASGGAAALAAAARTLDELRTALMGFEGCSLKAGARSTVFADGNPEAPVMVIGEAPGADEDAQGLPFVGASGRLLDRMLGSIGLDRQTSAYITNVVPWRPPINRKPSPAEVAVCLPFVERHIALVAPRVLLLVGGLAASHLLASKDGIMRLRGQWFDYATGLQRPVPTIATFHPAYLLRSPAEKRLAWRDLLSLRQRLDSLG